MARIRTVKPEFFTSEDVVALSPFARLLFIALWCESDREGRMYWKPKTFKMRYFPADDLSIDALCDELIGRDMVRLYGDGLAYIPTFLKHQHINPRESQSDIPSPESTREARVYNASTRDSDVQVGRKGKEGKEHASERDASFEVFWSAYPKRRNRGDAEKAWLKLKPTSETLAKILEAVEVASRSDDWRKDNGQFIPYPASWLNAKGWLDEGVALSRSEVSAPWAGAK